MNTHEAIEELRRWLRESRQMFNDYRAAAAALTDNKDLFFGETIKLTCGVGVSMPEVHPLEVEICFTQDAAFNVLMCDSFAAGVREIGDDLGAIVEKLRPRYALHVEQMAAHTAAVTQLAKTASTLPTIKGRGSVTNQPRAGGDDMARRTLEEQRAAIDAKIATKARRETLRATYKSLGKSIAQKDHASALAHAKDAVAVLTELAAN